MWRRAGASYLVSSTFRRSRHFYSSSYLCAVPAGSVKRLNELIKHRIWSWSILDIIISISIYTSASLLSRQHLHRSYPFALHYQQNHQHRPAQVSIYTKNIAFIGVRLRITSHRITSISINRRTIENLQKHLASHRSHSAFSGGKVEGNKHLEGEE